jgi:Ca-activated chloride channel family protein
MITLLSGYFTSEINIRISGTVYENSGKNPLYGANIRVKGTATSTQTDSNGRYSLVVPDPNAVLVVSAVGFRQVEKVVGQKSTIDFYLDADTQVLLPEAEQEESMVQDVRRNSSTAKVKGSMVQGQHLYQPQSYYEPQVQHNTEEYNAIQENIFHDPVKKPLSTFSIDVDAASYSNLRRFLRQGQMPPKDAVRIEEMVNYFTYDYPDPENEDPFSVYTEVSQAPWNLRHKLVHIGLQGRKIPTENLPPSNLVFLIDVSGSMNSANKLGLLKSAFKLLTNQLRPTDKVSLVVYAGAAGVVLPATAGNHKETILNALEQLQAGGSTAGGQGIQLAYKIAREQFVAGGNNRVILATDGDFNIGASSNAEMERLIEQERQHGVFLTVLGFGMGNYKDSKMEILADKGNGNYAYIDDIMEAKKVLVNEFGGTLFTIAKDVKLQIEFNPEHVKAYRLIGYENRMLRDEDFNDDRKDAGELGSGHTVTALYEIIPAGSESGSKYLMDIDELKYQQPKKTRARQFEDEMLTIKLRYKDPQGSKSRLISKVVPSNATALNASTNNFKWSAAVASFGMVLRDSEFKGNATYAMVEQWARKAQGNDIMGYRAEFIKLVQSVELLAQH